MILLDGAQITVRYDENEDKWHAVVMIGYSSSRASAQWLEVAIGKAVMLQASVTEAKLKQALKERGEE